MMSAKMTRPDILKIKLTWKEGYDATGYVHDVTNKILSRGSSFTADLVMWRKFGNSSHF